MKEVQDDHWIDKMKELLESYTPEDAPGDWLQVKRRLAGNRSWFERLVFFIRKRWIMAVIFGTGLLTGFFLFYPGKNEMGRTENPDIQASDQRESIHPVPNPDRPITILNTETLDRVKQSPISGRLKDPRQIKVGSGIELIPDLNAEAKHKIDLNTGLDPGGKIPEILKSDNITDLIQSVQLAQQKNADIQIITPDFLPSARSQSPPDSVTAPGPGDTSGNNGDDKPARKPRKPFDISKITLKGDPWKMGLGYEYLALIQPDTGKGFFRGVNISFNNEVAKRLWLGTGLTIGRTGLTEITKTLVVDRSKVDSLGFYQMRDSTVSEQRWQNHLALPVSVTYDLFRNSRFAVPFRAGITFGWVTNQKFINRYDTMTYSGKQFFPGGFIGFVTADLSLGYEVCYFSGLSATLAVDYRRVLLGPKSYGFGQNFIGGKIVLNFDFDKGKWR